MKKAIPFLMMLLWSSNLLAPPNCEVFKADVACYEACQEAMMAIRYPQGSYKSQQHFDQSIALCPDFAYSYMEKAVPFLKRGLFIEWKAMIDKAVELAPTEYLGYRGWCRLQFLRDYQGAIKDIERLKSLVSYDIGYCQTGDYHLDIVLALCYKHLGDHERARKLFLEHTSAENYSEGYFDFYHFGVLEYKTGNYKKSLEYLDRQIEVSDYLAETYYFKALAYKALNQPKEYTTNLEKALNYYQAGNIRMDTYTEPMDKIYLLDIQEEIEQGK